MVTNATTLGRNGVQDFVLLRASAVVLALYALFMVGFFATTPNLDYATWKDLFSGFGVKVFTLLALVAILVHAWIGLWQVLTDYVKAAGLRMALQFILNITALAYVISGFVILWGV